MSDDARKALYACDYCRQKKLKCTKELPKCRNCAAWPGPCTYDYSDSKELHQRQRKEKKRSKGSKSNSLRTANATSDFHHASPVITAAGDSVPSAHSNAPIEDFQPQNRTDCHNLINAETDSIPTEDPPSTAYSFAFLDSAAAKTSGTMGPDQAHEGLMALSNSIHATQAIDKSTTSAVEFHVPSRSVGYAMIGYFLELAEMSRPFMLVPSESIIYQTIFEPKAMVLEEPGWVVTINFIFLSAHHEQQRSCLSEAKLRSNMQVALNNSNIFLRPSEINVQALTYLAVHGEDYATPNTSWLVLSHACRQAEAISLHRPGKGSQEAIQQRLCAFWLLFIVDKSCALAFGRPAFLPSSTYSGTPLPSDEALRSFQPHESTIFDGRGQQRDNFILGAHFLKRGIGFAKLVGQVLESRPDDRRQMNGGLREQFNRWAWLTFQPLEDSVRQRSTPMNVSQQREVELGISTLRFQYLHALVVLLKDDSTQASFRLSSAREMLSMLSSVVSNHTSVYNGVVWHLLYYPFAPFFLIFEQVLTSDLADERQLRRDIDLLEGTSTYFAEMRLQMRTLGDVCSRLEHVADAFTKLARAHLGRNASLLAPSMLTGTTERTFVTDDSSQSTAAPEPHKGSHGLQEAVDRARTLLRDFSSTVPPDVTGYFNPAPMLSGSQTEINPNSVESPGAAGMNAFDMEFDWFAWDTYYTQDLSAA